MVRSAIKISGVTRKWLKAQIKKKREAKRKTNQFFEQWIENLRKAANKRFEKEIIVQKLRFFDNVC